jgi:hypothetical protein
MAMVPFPDRLCETVTVMPILIPLGVLLVVMMAMIVWTIVVAIVIAAVGHNLDGSGLGWKACCCKRS